MVSDTTYQRLHLRLHLRLLHGARHLKSVYFFHHFPSVSPFPSPPKRGVVDWSFRRVLAEIVWVRWSPDWSQSVLVPRWRATSQQAVGLRRWWCDRFGWRGLRHPLPGVGCYQKRPPKEDLSGSEGDGSSGKWICSNTVTFIHIYTRQVLYFIY